MAADLALYLYLISVPSAKISSDGSNPSCPVSSYIAPYPFKSSSSDERNLVNIFIPIPSLNLESPNP